jgi:hypothetical protein
MTTAPGTDALRTLFRGVKNQALCLDDLLITAVSLWLQNRPADPTDLDKIADVALALYDIHHGKPEPKLRLVWSRPETKSQTLAPTETPENHDDAC